VNDETRDQPDEPRERLDVEGPFRYHLELTPAQLKITHTALRSLLDDFGHDEPEILDLIREVLAKLPDEHAIRAIHLDRELDRERSAEGEESSSQDGKPPPAA
jgi:hypothetical protein